MKIRFDPEVMLAFLTDEEYDAFYSRLIELGLNDGTSDENFLELDYECPI